VLIGTSLSLVIDQIGGAASKRAIEWDAAAYTGKVETKYTFTILGGHRIARGKKTEHSYRKIGSRNTKNQLAIE
jgi:hypothetical protein